MLLRIKPLRPQGVPCQKPPARLLLPRSAHRRHSPWRPLRKPDTTAQPDEGVPRELLALLYADNSYMASLEHMVDLAVHANLFVRRNLLLWFQGYCRMHAKRIRSASDAKDYLANLLRPGSNTRAQFMAYQNRIYERQR